MCRVSRKPQCQNGPTERRRRRWRKKRRRRSRSTARSRRRRKKKANEEEEEKKKKNDNNNRRRRRGNKRRRTRKKRPPSPLSTTTAIITTRKRTRRARRARARKRSTRKLLSTSHLQTITVQSPLSGLPNRASLTAAWRSVSSLRPCNGRAHLPTVFTHRYDQKCFPFMVRLRGRSVLCGCEGNAHRRLSLTVPNCLLKGMQRIDRPVN